MSQGILEEQSSDPIKLFSEWMDLAKQTEVNDSNAAALATAGTDGRPSVRMVLIKHFDTGGFRFFTNALSRKGQEIGQNPWASLCIHWKSLRRQVRVEGRVEVVNSEIAKEYFHSRSRRSQIAAVVSHQSERLESRAVLECAVEEFSATYEGLEIPVPESWIGFSLKPDQIEFWSDGEDRLHERLLFTKAGNSWNSSPLYP